VLVLGVALLAGFIFIGGLAAIYLSTPPQPQQPVGLIGDTTTPGPSLADFTQETPGPSPTAAPTPTPFFFSPDPGSLSPFPSDFLTPTPSMEVTPTPIVGPNGPTPTPTSEATPTPTSSAIPTSTPAGPRAGFTFTVSGNTVQFTDKSTGTGLTYSWDFGDGKGKFTQSPKHVYPDLTATYTVVLTVTDANGLTDTRTKTVDITQSTPPPPTPTPPASTPTPVITPPPAP